MKQHIKVQQLQYILPLASYDIHKGLRAVNWSFPLRDPVRCWNVTSIHIKIMAWRDCLSRDISKETTNSIFSLRDIGPARPTGLFENPCPFSRHLIIKDLNLEEPS